MSHLCDMMVADAALLRDVVSLHSFSVILNPLFDTIARRFLLDS